MTATDGSGFGMGAGEVLSARVYREYGPPRQPSSAVGGPAAGLELASFGTASTASHTRVHALGTIWGG